MNRRARLVPVPHDRRVRWFERRQHAGPFRFLWIPVGDLARRTAAVVLSIF